MNGADRVRHFGNMVGATDSLDCRYKRSMLIGYVIKLMIKYGYPQSKALLRLFNAPCCSFYGSSLWGLVLYSTFGEFCTYEI